MFTLAELYFPSTHGALQALMSQRDEAAEVHGSFRAIYKINGQPSQEHAKALSAVLQRFSAAIEKYRKELAQYAKHDGHT